MPGAFLGLALLTKQPALTLVPYFMLLLILWQLEDSYHKFHNLKKSVIACISIATVTRVSKAFFIILFIAGLIFVIIWPAMWVTPIDTLKKLEGGLMYVVENPHENYGFFQGQIITTDKYGPLFYIIVILMKSTPIVLFFSTICIISMFISFRNMKLSKMNFIILCFLLYILLFFALMSVAEKKGDRYLLPIFPVIDILAAIGIYYCYKYIPNFLKRTVKIFENIQCPANTVFGIIILLVVLLQSVLIIPLAPYYLSYFNPLVLGGSQHAHEYIGIGWGEGQDLAAAYLNNKPDASNLTVGVQYAGFKEYFIGKTVSMGDPNSKPPDYLVFYSCAVQRNFNGNLLEKYRNETPEKVIIINNIEYCWIYPTHKDQVS